VKLTLMPDRLLRADLAQLRAVGLSDLEVLDLTHVVALVTWLNRLCQTLGEPVATADEPTSLP
jgi:alkylhydroperoxidase family enzyme